MVGNTEAITRQEFACDNAPNFWADPRSKSVWHTPRPSVVVGDLPPSTEVTSSFHGGSCHSCFYDNQCHSINNNKQIFILGDEFSPPKIGSRGRCCPVIRVNQGSFDQLKQVILHHLRNKLRIKEGSIIVTLLMTHLMKVGFNKYTSEFKSFASWVRCLMPSVTVLPSIAPYNTGHDLEHLISVSQLYHSLQGEFLGKGPVDNDLSFVLWRPLHQTALELSVSRISVPAPPIFIESAQHMLKCDSMFYAGFEVDWTEGMPKSVQATFFCMLTETLVNMNILERQYSPSKDDILAGLSGSPHHGRKIFLAGSSILRDAAPTLINLSKDKGVQVYSAFKSNDFLGFLRNLDKSLFKSADKNDICILNFFGNLMLYKASHKTVEGVVHLDGPALPTDEDIGLLILDLGRVLRSLLDSFPGRIFLLGPTPRHVTPCCNDTNHAINSLDGSPLDMVAYTRAFTSYIQASPGVVQNRVYLVTYQEIFKGKFLASYLTDGVHLNGAANSILAEFLLSLLDSRRISAPVKLTNLLFSDYLVEQGISSSATTAMEEGDIECIKIALQEPSF